MEVSKIIACVASVSARVRCESSNESEKKKKERGGGGGGGGEEKKRLQVNPTILKNPLAQQRSV